MSRTRLLFLLLLLRLSHGIKLRPAPPPSQTARPPRSCYVHLPFCRRRCFYCDFTIEVVGDKPREATMEEYVELVRREVRATALVHGGAVAAAGGLETIYFGGGTPSLVPPRLVASIVSALEEGFGGLAPECEITLEADPGTFTASSLDAYQRQCGVNRVSLGVQGWDEEVLRQAGRAHTVAEGEAAVEAVSSAAGLASWSLDLIAGLPFQTEQSWRGTLERTVRASPKHISVYDLQVEDGTAFGRWYDEGVWPLPSESDAALYYRIASEVLKASGYEHYEVSSYALKGGASSSDKSPFRSRHNAMYWSMDPFLAFGMGASSMAEKGRRFARPSTRDAYKRWVDIAEDVGIAAACELVTDLDAPTDGLDSEDMDWGAAERPRRTPSGGSGSSSSPSSDSSSSSSSSSSVGSGSGSSSSGSSSSGSSSEGEEEIGGEGLMTEEDMAEEALDDLQEWLMVSLRTSDGFDLDECAGRYGPDAAETILTALGNARERGLLVVHGRGGGGGGGGGGVEDAAADGENAGEGTAAKAGKFGVARLTDPDGFLFSNDVISTVFAEMGEAELL